ncbi:MAG: hypothetical protein LBF50_00155 [Azoarcus sp.]|nr:hypothetical protein [Azoarcus sp.]
MAVGDDGLPEPGKIESFFPTAGQPVLHVHEDLLEKRICLDALRGGRQADAAEGKPALRLPGCGGGGKIPRDTGQEHTGFFSIRDARRPALPGNPVQCNHATDRETVPFPCPFPSKTRRIKSARREFRRVYYTHLLASKYFQIIFFNIHILFCVAG